MTREDLRNKYEDQSGESYLNGLNNVNYDYMLWLEDMLMCEKQSEVEEMNTERDNHHD